MMSPERRAQLYTGSKPSETALSDVDNGTGSIEWADNGMGSRWSRVGVTTYTESGDAFEMD